MEQNKSLLRCKQNKAPDSPESLITDLGWQSDALHIRRVRLNTTYLYGKRLLPAGFLIVFRCYDVPESG